MNTFGNIIRYTLVLVLLLNLFLLTGCFDQREIDELAYPMAIGLDVGEANELRMTLQLAVPISIGGGSGGGEGGGGGGSVETTSIITVDTPSIYSGLNLINNIISKEINVSHTKVIIISRRLAEKGVSKYLNAIMRGSEFKPDVFIVVSLDSPEEYLRKTKHILEVNPSKYYEQMLGKNFTSFFPNVRLHDFHLKYSAGSIEPVAILTALNRYESVEQFGSVTAENGDGTFIHEGSYKAGNIPILSDKKNEVMGVAVFKEGKMCSTLNGMESACLQMVTGEFNHTYWTLPDLYEENSIIVLKVFRRKKPVIKIDMAEGKVKAHVGIDLEGDFVSIQSMNEYESQPEIIERRMEEILEKDILKLLEKTRDTLGSDICGFGKFVKKKFLTWAEWEKYNWPEQYKHTVFDVDVSFRIRRTGLIIKSAHW